MGTRHYLYYPGCTLKGSGKHYEESFLRLFKALDVSLREIDDWNCCGATAYMSIDEPSAFAMAGRILALAEAQGGNDSAIVAPCSACYQVLTKAREYLSEYPALGERIRGGLRKIGLEYTGKSDIRHPLDVLVNDIGIELIKAKQTRSLEGLRIVPYYGCLLVRPYARFDDTENPVTMDLFFEELGADVPDFSLKTRCCGGSLMGTMREVGTRLNEILLTEAHRLEADIIATACPLCQFNLEVAQLEGSNGKKKIPVLYFTQVIGLALGIPAGELGLSRQIISPESAMAAMREEEVSLG